MWARIAVVLCGSAMLVLAVGERTTPAPEDQASVQAELELHEELNAGTDPMPGLVLDADLVLVDDEVRVSSGP